MLQKLEFEEFMSQLGVFLARQELRVVFDSFDANKDGNIAYAEFVNVLKVSQTLLTEHLKVKDGPATRLNRRPSDYWRRWQQLVKAILIWFVF